MAENWTTIKESCRLLGKTDRTIRRWIASGRLPCQRTSEGLRVNIGAVMKSGHATDNDKAQAANNDTILLQADVRRLTETVMALTADRDYLRDALQREQQVQLVRQIPDNLESSRRRWWQIFHGSTS